MADESKTQTTEYVVLRQMPEGPIWEEVGTASGMNAQQAIKQVAEGEGTFIAVPARSWKPLTRKVETVTKDVWS